jgi:hypothetical protein
MKKEYRKLSPEEIEEIYLTFRKHSISTLAAQYGCSITQMNNIYSQCIHRMKHETAIREYKDWNTEEEIFEALEPTYDPSELKGWELKEYRKLCERSF